MKVLRPIFILFVLLLFPWQSIYAEEQQSPSQTMALENGASTGDIPGTRTDNARPKVSPREYRRHQNKLDTCR